MENTLRRMHYSFRETLVATTHATTPTIIHRRGHTANRAHIQYTGKTRASLGWVLGNKELSLVTVGLQRKTKNYHLVGKLVESGLLGSANFLLRNLLISTSSSASASALHVTPGNTIQGRLRSELNTSALRFGLLASISRFFTATPHTGRNFPWSPWAVDNFTNKSHLPYAHTYIHTGHTDAQSGHKNTENRPYEGGVFGGDTDCLHFSSPQHRTHRRGRSVDTFRIFVAVVRILADEKPRPNFPPMLHSHPFIHSMERWWNLKHPQQSSGKKIQVGHYIFPVFFHNEIF